MGEGSEWFGKNDDLVNLVFKFKGLEQNRCSIVYLWSREAKVSDQTHGSPCDYACVWRF